MIDLHDGLVDGLNKLSISCSDLQLDQLVRFAGLLQRWNKVYNLTAIRRDEEILTHHLLDSAALVPLVEKFGPGAKTVLDVGSGGGLPSVPLAILRPDLRVTAVDAVSKKTAFLTQTGIELGLKNFSARHARVEKLQGNYDLISSRAFASLFDFTALTMDLLAPQGAWLAMKGVQPLDEIAALPTGIVVDSIVPMEVPGLSEERHLVVLKRSC